MKRFFLCRRDKHCANKTGIFCLVFFILINSCSDGAHAFYANFHRRIRRLRSKWLRLRTTSCSSHGSRLVGPVSKRISTATAYVTRGNLWTGRWKWGWSVKNAENAFSNIFDVGSDLEYFFVFFFRTLSPSPQCFFVCVISSYFQHYLLFFFS